MARQGAAGDALIGPPACRGCKEITERRRVETTPDVGPLGVLFSNATDIIEEIEFVLAKMEV
jgi:hypothetical protein